MITIVDSGGANLSSILFALERLGVCATISTHADQIKNASKVILPGVGSANRVMQRLSFLQLVDVLQCLTQPVLGICVGMQVLFDFADEGNVACLNILSGRIKKLRGEAIMPHVGWNKLDIRQDSPILKNIPNASYVYFVHSFALPISSCTAAVTHYGESFSAVVQHRNFFGTQFHPERSSKVGSEILKNFVEL